MIVRRHEDGGTVSSAVYSDCEAYRYRLSRRWGDGDCVNFIMLNPSVADEIRNDPTIARCERRARAGGFGAVTITNLFAWRDTDPFAMRRATAPIGTETDRIILQEAEQADQVVACWGVHGAHLGRGHDVERRLRAAGIALTHLGLTRDGHPRHPLYLPYSRSPEPWTTI